MRYLYSLLFYLLQPLIAMRLLLRSRRAAAYRSRWLERYGFSHRPVMPNGILIHAVSMGETLAAVPLVKAIQQHYPDLAITFTTTTPTGSAEVTRHFGDSLKHCYLPYDLPGSMRRFLQRIQPKLVIIMETEIWPNLLHQLGQAKIPVILANARLSARSAQRYQRVPHLNQIMAQLTLIAAQSETDADRFVLLGCPQSQVTIMGNLKFNLSFPDLAPSVMLTRSDYLDDRPVWIAGSTHRGEETLLLMAQQQLLQRNPDLLLIVVPRHPERFNEVEALLQQQQFSYQRRSDSLTIDPSTQVLLGNTMGELRLLYAMADIAFIGGSLIEHGGQNPLEAIYYGLPILMGPSRFNFAEICQKLQQQQLLKEVSDAESIVQQLQGLLENPEQRAKLSEQATVLLQQNQQALSTLMGLIAPYLRDHS